MVLIVPSALKEVFDVSTSRLGDSVTVVCP
jgi:hypothetical protein